LALVLVFGAGLIAVGGYGNWRSGNAQRVERMIVIAREKGEPTTPEEMAEFHATSPAIDRTTRLWLEAMASAEPPGATSEDRENVAYVGYGLDDDPDSQEAMRRLKAEGVMTPEIYAASKAYLPKVERAIEVAHEARRSGTLARYPLDYEYVSPESIGARRALANTFALYLAVRRADGETDRFLDVHLSFLAFAESMQAEPGHVCQFARLALLGIAREQLLISLEKEELSADNLAELQRAWDAVDLSAALRLALLDEQMVALHYLPEELHLSLERDWRPCPEEDAYQAAKALRSVIDASDNLDAADAAIESAQAELDRAMEAPLASYRFVGWAETLRFIDANPEAVRRHWTEVDALRMILACERFRLERGDWPGRLEDLVPDYLDSLPPDRYDSGTIKYRREPGGIIVYAVGPDGSDDAGTLDPHVRATPTDVGVRLKLEPETSEEPVQE
jgi:hypothetical protein